MESVSSAGQIKFEIAFKEDSGDVLAIDVEGVKPRISALFFTDPCDEGRRCLKWCHSISSQTEDSTNQISLDFPIAHIIQLKLRALVSEKVAAFDKGVRVQRKIDKIHEIPIRIQPRPHLEEGQCYLIEISLIDGYFAATFNRQQPTPQKQIKNIGMEDLKKQLQVAEKKYKLACAHHEGVVDALRVMHEIQFKIRSLIK